jgi:hypothetical protein
MSRTLRRTVIACRVPAAGVAAVLLLVACGGGDGYSAATPSAASSSAPDSAEATDAAGTTVPSGTVDFCTQAAGLDQRVESALTDRKDDDPSVPDAFHQIAEELRGIDAPAVITSDWDAMAAGLDRMADAFANFDITDSTSLAALDEAERGLTSASKNVENYLRDECGINP